MLHGDTQISHKGMDTYGSRSLAVGGIAVVKAAREGGRQGAQGRRAHARGVRGRPRVLRRAASGCRGTDKGVTIQDVALAVVRGAQPARGRRAVAGLRRHLRPGELLLPARHAPRRDGGRHRDRPGRRSAATSASTTSARCVNPLIVEGQVHGGLAQGIAQALFEEAIYDEQGTLVNGTFVDYTLPSASDLPSFTTDRTETPATSNPLGVKGVGEAGTIASTPAVVNGVVDAVRHLGVERRRDAVHAAARVAGASRRRRAAPPRRRRSTPTRRVPASARSTRTTRRKKRSSDPGAVRLRQARHGRRGRGGAAARPARTPRSSPAGRA